MPIKPLHISDEIVLYEQEGHKSVARKEAVASMLTVVQVVGGLAACIIPVLYSNYSWAVWAGFGGAIVLEFGKGALNKSAHDQREHYLGLVQYRDIQEERPTDVELYQKDRRLRSDLVPRSPSKRESFKARMRSLDHLDLASGSVKERVAREVTGLNEKDPFKAAVEKVRKARYEFENSDYLKLVNDARREAYQETGERHSLETPGDIATLIIQLDRVVARRNELFKDLPFIKLDQETIDAFKQEYGVGPFTPQQFSEREKRGKELIAVFEEEMSWHHESLLAKIAKRIPDADIAALRKPFDELFGKRLEEHALREEYGNLVQALRAAYNNHVSTQFTPSSKLYSQFDDLIQERLLKAPPFVIFNDKELEAFMEEASKKDIRAYDITRLEDRVAPLRQKLQNDIDGLHKPQLQVAFNLLEGERSHREERDLFMKTVERKLDLLKTRKLAEIKAELEVARCEGRFGTYYKQLMQEYFGSTFDPVFLVGRLEALFARESETRRLNLKARYESLVDRFSKSEEVEEDFNEMLAELALPDETVERLLKGIKKEGELKALYDKSEKELKEVAAQFEKATTLDAYNQLLKEVEAIKARFLAPLHKSALWNAFMERNKVEAFKLNVTSQDKELQRLDQQYARLHNGKVYIVEGFIPLAFAILAIISVVYRTNPWLFVGAAGGGVLILIGRNLSDRKLEKIRNEMKKPKRENFLREDSDTVRLKAAHLKNLAHVATIGDRMIEQRAHDQIFNIKQPPISRFTSLMDQIAS